jgi:hypothetical protein
MAFDFIETSAKRNQNVFMAFKRLAQLVTETFDPKLAYNVTLILSQIKLA